VLVTSLLDGYLYPTQGFLALYHLRWGIETFYGLLKTRLELENFTGTGAEAVRHDCMDAGGRATQEQLPETFMPLCIYPAWNRC